MGTLIARELTERDVHGALSVVAEATASTADGPFGLPMLEQFGELIGAEQTLYIEYDLNTKQWSPSSVEYPVVVYPASVCYADVRDHNPLSEEAVGATAVPLTLSDFLTPRASRRNPYVQEVLRPVGFEHEMKIFLPAPPGTTRGFAFTRGPGTDFDARERAILQLLRPHLTRLQHRWEQRTAATTLTAREREVLGHLARGLTNREIAQQLVVSTHTVRSHLNHIYEKLDVHTRTAAITAARPR